MAPVKKLLSFPKECAAGEPPESLVDLSPRAPMAGYGDCPDQGGGVPSVRGEGGDPGGERPRRSVPGDRRPVGRREKRQTDGERGIPLQQPEGLVAVPGGPQLAGGHRRPDEAENRVPLLYRAEGAGGVQRPGHGGALCGHAVASHAERAPYPGAGDGGEPAAGVVAVLPGPRVEGEGPQPDGEAAQRLPGLRRADEGGKPRSHSFGRIIHPKGCLHRS